MPTKYSMRTGPSGPRALPVPSRGILGWNGSGTQNLVILPAGHQPGIYTVGLTCFVRAAASGGAFTGSTVTWGMVGVAGLSSIAFAPGVPTSTGIKINAYRSLPSSGLSAITWNVVGAAITGTPLIDIVAYAKLVALNPSS